MAGNKDSVVLVRNALDSKLGSIIEELKTLNSHFYLAFSVMEKRLEELERKLEAVMETPLFQERLEKVEVEEKETKTDGRKKK